MSHEIKFVSAEEAAHEASLVKLTGTAIQPAKVRIDKTGGTGMEIEWRDGHKSAWSFTWLRDACPCATCHEAREAEGLEPGDPKPAPKALFPVYKEPAKPREVTPVGKYAVRFTWNDGHEAGLYSWDYLRNVCDEQRKK
ncbi:MAG: DUF971 domain-containing protein [Acidobacteriaceae bacterium]|nr:DUF971 domain-containing protein [Acidobacteriaceae bacterium]